MNTTKLLVGSLSNDLFRIASLRQRGANAAAARFLTEAKKWASLLTRKKTSPYIKKIATKVLKTKETKISLTQAEHFLMYAVLLENYSLHTK